MVDAVIHSRRKFGKREGLTGTQQHDNTNAAVANLDLLARRLVRRSPTRLVGVTAAEATIQLGPANLTAMTGAAACSEFAFALATSAVKIFAKRGFCPKSIDYGRKTVEVEGFAAENHNLDGKQAVIDHNLVKM